MPAPKEVNYDFFKKWTPDMAYVLGFFAADGYLTLNRRGGQFWCIQITDKDLLQSIRAVLQSKHKISERLGRGKPLYRLQIGSVEMCSDLRRLGFKERKADSMSIPNVPQKYLPHFTRGYFDGDGNIWTGLIHKKRRTSTRVLFTAFTSCSIAFLDQLKVKLAEVCTGGCVYKSKRNYARLQYSSQDSLKLYGFMYNHGVNLSNMLFLDRKRKVFERYVKMRP